jgi:hypothetical protein
MNSFKSILTELLWLIIAFIVATLFCYLLFDWDARGAIIDPQRSDTYFIISTGTIVSPIFLLVTFVLYFIKEIHMRFSKTVPNTVPLIYCAPPSFVHWVVATPLGGWEVCIGMHKTWRRAV